MATNGILDTLLTASARAKRPPAANRDVFYPPIRRTGDLVKASRLFGRDGFQADERSIAPSPVRLGRLPTKVLDEMQKALVLKTAPSGDDVVRDELDELVQKYGEGNPSNPNVMEAKLEKKGFAGELNTVARRLNAARLSPLDRAIFSRSNLAMYTFYRAIVGLDVEDVDGILSNARSSLGKVTSHLNRELVKKVIDEKNLEATDEEIKDLQDRMASRQLSYEGEDATEAILAEYEDLKGKGDLIKAVEEFLDAGVITIPDNVDRDQLVKNMIAFLEEKGFNPKVIIGLDADFTFEADGLTVQFEDKSKDDVEVTRREWNFGDDSPASDKLKPKHTYAKAGTYTVTLEVEDADGNKDSASRDVTVSGTSSPPSTSPPFTYQEEGLNVRFKHGANAGASVTRRRWKFGDGASASSKAPEHTYARSGTYTVTLEVTHKNGDKSTFERRVEVEHADGPHYVEGKLVDADSNEPLPNLTVRAFDSDPNGPDQLLGQPASTGDKGTFRIHYKDEDFKPEHPKSPNPDLVLRIYQEGNDDPIHEVPRQKNAKLRLDLKTVKVKMPDVHVEVN